MVEVVVVVAVVVIAVVVEEVVVVAVVVIAVVVEVVVVVAVVVIAVVVKVVVVVAVVVIVVVVVVVMAVTMMMTERLSVSNTTASRGAIGTITGLYLSVIASFGVDRLRVCWCDVHHSDLLSVVRGRRPPQRQQQHIKGVHVVTTPHRGYS